MHNKKQTNKYIWDLSHVVKDPSEKHLESIKAQAKIETQSFSNKWKNRTDYLNDALTLREALDDYEEWSRSSSVDGGLGYYFSLAQAVDTQNESLKAKESKLIEFINEQEDTIRFFYMNIAKIDPKLQKEFLAHQSLQKYKHFLEEAFLTAKFLLSEKEERIVSLLSEPASYNWVRMVSDILSKEEARVLNDKGEPERVPLEIVYSLVSNENKKVRSSSAKAIQKITRKHADIATSELNSILNYKKNLDQLRGYKRPDEARHLSDDIESQVVDTLVKTVSARFDIAHKFFELKAKLLNLTKLEYYERGVDYGSSNTEYPFEKSVEIVRNTLKNLDPEFSHIFDKLLHNNQIDVYPQKNKMGGAFCAHNMINQPTYILLNYTNKLDDVKTLAHEVGHAINNELIKQHQNALYFGNSVAVAEVASTFMEDFVVKEIIKDSTEEEKLTIMLKKAEAEISSIQAQVALYMFEQEMHETYKNSMYLSKNLISEMFNKHIMAYSGPFVAPLKGTNYRWVTVSHFRSFFYVYSYASGLLISKYLQKSVQEDPDFINYIKKLLSTGTSKSPRETFLELGIDITDSKFWEKGLSEQNKLLSDIEEHAKKLGKIKY